MNKNRVPPIRTHDSISATQLENVKPSTSTRSLPRLSLGVNSGVLIHDLRTLEGVRYPQPTRLVDPRSPPKFQLMAFPWPRERSRPSVRLALSGWISGLGVLWFRRVGFRGFSLGRPTSEATPEKTRISMMARSMSWHARQTRPCSRVVSVPGLFSLSLSLSQFQNTHALSVKRNPCQESRGLNEGGHQIPWAKA